MLDAVGQLTSVRRLQQGFDTCRLLQYNPDWNGADHAIGEIAALAWYTTTHIAEPVYRISEPIGAIEPRVGLSTVNIYLVLGQERAALIDSGMGIGDLRAEVRKITSLPCTVLNTHYHWDHIGGNRLFPESAIHESEVDLLAEEAALHAVRKATQSSAARALLPPYFDPTAYLIVPKPATRILQDNDVIDLGGPCAQSLSYSRPLPWAPGLLGRGQRHALHRRHRLSRSGVCLL